MESRIERRHHEPRKGGEDPRAAAARDRDRLLYCNALRRLAGVTQVVSPSEGDVVHNRLTHSLKVAQIARRLAEKLIRENDAKDLDPLGGLHPEVAEAAALAHDLGHPPFGHIGEKALNASLLAHGDEPTEGYEGNPQSFRIVTKLQVRTDKPVGLNLTRASLNGILKYPWLKATQPEKNKWGAYSEDRDDFLWVRANSKEKKRSLEADIMDWADDITYAVHDVEDFFRAGLIPLHALARDEEERAHFLTRTYEKWERNQTKRLKDWDRYKQRFEELFKIMAIRGPYRGTRSEQALLRTIGSELITGYVNAARLCSPDKDSCLQVDPDSQFEVLILKELNWHYVIQSPALATQQRGQEEVIKTLFRIYAEDKERRLVPNWILAELDHECSESRRAADIVASLNDAQALRLHQRLTGLSPGSITDWF